MTVVSCNSGFYPVGTTACKASNAADATGYYWNSATMSFSSCDPSCLTCQDSTSSGCTQCPGAPSNWVQPTSDQANYATYIQGTRALINNTCYSDCPSGFIANSDHSNCVTVTSSSAILAIFVLFALIFNLWSIVYNSFKPICYQFNLIN